MTRIEELNELNFEELIALVIKTEGEKSKIVNNVKKLNKELDGFVKELKESASGVSDDLIIASYNNSIPSEYATTDINVALRSSRKTMNAITKQRVQELKVIIEDIK